MSERILAEGKIIPPPQYSIAWLILAVLCIIVIAALLLAVLRLTRRAVEKRAVAHQPTDADGLKAEYLRAANAIQHRFDAGDIDARTAHRELSRTMRSFVRRTTGLDVTSQDLVTLRADQRTRAVGELMASLQEPEFARSSDVAIQESLRRAREVIRAWS